MDDWQKPEMPVAARLLDEVLSYLSPVPFSRESTSVRTMSLPFYRDYTLLELTDFSVVPAARKYALHKPGDVHVISWTNQPIYAVNEKAPITLNDETIIPYVRFFFNYVRGRHGRFIIIEAVDDIRWQADPPLQGRKAIQDILSPIKLIDEDDEGTYTLEAFMVFKDSLFKTKVHVKKDGLVSMSSEELKVEGMPVLQDAVA